MCRNIRTLFNFDPPATDDEIHAAALQYVRKISGFAGPSATNEGVIFGCTELPLILEKSEFGIPFLNTTAIHVESIVDYIRQG